jgi:hypothetical protein
MDGLHYVSTCDKMYCLNKLRKETQNADDSTTE